MTRSGEQRVSRQVWCYPLFGLGFGIVVLLFAVFPSNSIWVVAGSGFTGAAIGSFFIRRIVYLPATAPQYRRRMMWLVGVGVLLVGGIFLAQSVGRIDQAFWLSWVAALFLIAATCSGVWVIEGAPSAA